MSKLKLTFWKSAIQQSVLVARSNVYDWPHFDTTPRVESETPAVTPRVESETLAVES
jgi:hypothetical protein